MGLLVGRTAGAAPDPADQCEATKLKAAGKKASCLATGRAKIVEGKSADLAKCDATMLKSFEKAEDKAAGACARTGEAGEIVDLVDACIDDVAAALVNAPPAACPRLPGTGQTTTFNAEKNDGIPTAVPVADDGTLQLGTLRYTDNGNGTITDENTGLTWEKKSDDGGLHDVDHAFPWTGNGSQETIWDWLDDVNAEGGSGFAGHDDWRIPNVKELASLLSYGAPTSATPVGFAITCVAGCTVTACNCTVDAQHWSSTTFAGDPTFAWDADFLLGFVLITDKGFSNSVRAVRGGA